MTSTDQEISHKPGQYWVWLASYPKSGNTWCRYVIETYLRGGIMSSLSEGLTLSTIYSDRSRLDQSLGFDTSDLALEEIRQYRIDAFQWFAQRRELSPYVKIHDAYNSGTNDTPVIPVNESRRVVYLVRNPLDIIASYAHHSGTSLDVICDLIDNDNGMINSWENGIRSQIPQLLRNWSSHVKSWLEQTQVEVLCVRYEDMLKDPQREFRRILSFIEESYIDEDILKSSIEQCCFQNMKRLEKTEAFRESLSVNRKFFRRGKAGTWRKVLTKKQIDAVTENHHEVMTQMGYL